LIQRKGWVRDLTKRGLKNNATSIVFPRMRDPAPAKGGIHPLIADMVQNKL